MRIGERKMEIGKIISEEIKKLIGKLTCKIQKVILYLYPEMTNFQKDIRKEKIKLKKEEINYSDSTSAFHNSRSIHIHAIKNCKCCISCILCGSCLI